MPKKSSPQTTLSLTINDHTLTGAKRRGRWRFDCPSWPELAAKYQGADTQIGILDEFVGRCLAPARAVRRLAGTIGREEKA